MGMSNGNVTVAEVIDFVEMSRGVIAGIDECFATLKPEDRENKKIQELTVLLDRSRFVADQGRRLVSALRVG